MHIMRVQCFVFIQYKQSKQVGLLLEFENYTRKRDEKVTRRYGEHV